MKGKDGLTKADEERSHNLQENDKPSEDRHKSIDAHDKIKRFKTNDSPKNSKEAQCSLKKENPNFISNSKLTVS
ncbi:putative voltage-dependent T-type calcium channel subunit alpha-1G [Sesbania bispinosa]|nr:putative voltage-dependent T-type calcium channel subunit alpha-1G [Sesbania bispinosa]